MQSFKMSPLLPITDNVFADLRKLHNLHKPGRLEEAVNILNDWLQKQAHFLKKDYSKQYLDILLIRCKGSVEKAKQQLDYLATMRTLVPKFFTLTHVDELGADLTYVLQTGLCVLLPALTPDMYRVAIIKLQRKHYDSDKFILFYQVFVMICEYLKAYDYVNGYVIIFDLQETNIMDIATKLKLVEFHQFITIMLKCYGVRVKAAYDITDSTAIQVLLKIQRPFLSEKIYNRIKIIPKGEDLQKYLPKEMLPAEYGGNEKSIHVFWDEWIKEISKPGHQEYLKTMNRAGTDESLRTSCKFNEEILGMPGSFRHLSVD